MLPALFFCPTCPEHPGRAALGCTCLVSATGSKADSLSDSVPHSLTRVSHIHSLSGRGTVTPQNKQLSRLGSDGSEGTFLEL